jgi:hypothetical protein
VWEPLNFMKRWVTKIIKTFLGAEFYEKLGHKNHLDFFAVIYQPGENRNGLDLWQNPWIFRASKSTVQSFLKGYLPVHEPL